MIGRIDLDLTLAVQALRRDHEGVSGRTYDMLNRRHPIPPRPAGPA